MIVIASALIGGIVGWRRAGARGGDRFDRWQYAAVHAIAFAILGMFVTIAIDRAV